MPVDETPISIIGRDAEREQIASAVVAGRATLILVQGDPGIGKSTLWRHGVGIALGAGMRVLEARPAEAERSLTFAGLASLLPDTLLDEVSGTIAAPRRRALDAALLRGEPGTAGVDPVVLGMAFGSVLDHLAAMSGVVVAIDDLQWLDEATAGVVAFALRRQPDARVTVLAATRDAPGSPVTASVPESRRLVIRPGPLSVGALGRIIADRTGTSLPRTVTARIHDLAGGNPFIALELARAMLARDRLPGPHDPIDAPADAALLIEGRLARLSPSARTMLAVIAATARPTHRLVERVLGEAETAAAYPALVAEDLARSDGEVLRCSHPLVASVAYGATFPARRRSLHARIADALDDVEEVARHRALATDGPSEPVAAALDVAATAARQRGASLAAAGLAELAADMTPPLDVEARAERELVVADCRLGAGAFAEARDIAQRALDRLPTGPRRVDGLILLARITAEQAELGEARDWLRRALEEAGNEPVASARANVAMALQGWYDTGAERRHARRALELLDAGRAAGVRDAGTEAVALVVLADADLHDGLGPRYDLLDRAVELEREVRLPLVERPTTHRANYLGHAGRHRESITAIRDVLAVAEREGDAGIRPHLLRTLAWMELCAGRLADSLRDARLAVDAGQEIGIDDANAWAIAAHAAALAGRLDDADAWGARALERARVVGSAWAEIRALGALGCAALGRADPRGAAASLGTARAILDRERVGEPGWYRVDGDLAEALVGSGRLDDAAAVVAMLDAAGTRGGHPWTRLVAARSRGLLEAALGRFDRAEAAFRASLAGDPDDEAPLEQGRTLLAFGATLRRVNRRREAREVLATAAARFTACAAQGLAERAVREIGAVSGRVASPLVMTAMEARVAGLAAAGRTNREIASEEFLSVRTVESHLSSAFRKLGVRSRTELAARLADRDRA